MSPGTAIAVKPCAAAWRANSSKLSAAAANAASSTYGASGSSASRNAPEMCE